MAAAAEKVTGRKIPLKITGRRPGDPAELVASYAKAQELLGWQPESGLEEIISSAWKWQQKKPRDEA